MICLLGANGQIGRAIESRLLSKKIPYKSFTKKDADFLSSKSVLELLDLYQPSLIINASAYTQVDLAETHKEEVIQINCRTPEKIAQWCKKNGRVLIHFSTDYVYSGEGESYWSETSPTNPQNMYGVAKLMGDLAIQKVGCEYIIFRTSWVYDEAGNNFLNKMISLGRQHTELFVVDDQFGSPTYAGDLADATINTIMTKSNFASISGVYNLCGNGITCWFGFAEEIFRLVRRFEPLKLEVVKPIPSEGYPSPAKRPHNSRLNQEKASMILGLKLPDWKSSLLRCIESKYGNS